MTTIDATLTRLERGRHQGRGGVVRLPDLRLLDARGHAGHDRRLHSGRLRARVRPANTRSRCSRSWRSRWSPRGSSRSSSRRCSARDPEAAERRARTRSPAASSASSAASSALAIRMRWLTIAATLALFVVAVPGAAADAAAVLPVLRPSRAAGRSDAAAERLDLRQRVAGRTASTRLLKGDPDVERWSTYVGRGAIRFYLPLNVQLPNDFFSQAVIVAKDVAARDRLKAKLERRWRTISRRGRPRLSARARAAGRLADAISRERPADLGRCARSPRSSPAWSRPTAERRERQLRLDGAGPAGAHRHRPGRGAAARPELAADRERAQHRA